MKTEYAIIINIFIKPELNNIGFCLGHVFKYFSDQMMFITETKKKYTFTLLMPGVLTGS